MNILILGSQPIVQILLNRLCQDGHNITVISDDYDSLEHLREHYEIQTLLGTPSLPEVQRKAKAKHCDSLIALTPSDEINMVACQVAHSMFHVPLKIAQITNAHYVVRKELFGTDNLPIDVFINPDKLVAQAVCGLINHDGADEVTELCGGQWLTMVVPLTSNASILGLTREELEKTYSGLAILNHLKTGPSPFIEASDRLMVLATSSAAQTFMSACGHQQDVNQVMVTGGGGILRQLAGQVGTEHNLIFLDSKRQHCLELAAACPKATILHGDINDTSTMKEEGIHHMDYFCALGCSDSQNIVTAMQAKKWGAKRTIAMVKRPDYHIFANSPAVGTVLSPYFLMNNSIYGALVHHANVHYAPFFRAPGTLMSWPYGTPAPHIFTHGQRFLLREDNVLAAEITTAKPGDTFVVYEKTGLVY